MSVKWWYMRPCVAFMVIFIFFKFAVLSVWLGHRGQYFVFPNDHTHGLQYHGDDTCYRDPEDTLVHLADNIHTSCSHSPSPLTQSDVRIGKLIVHVGANSAVYNPAIRSHHLHALVHGMPVYILCSPAVDGMWNKPAFVLSVLLSEIVKPEDERLEWLMWTDRDSLVLDHCRNPAAFLPPGLGHAGVRLVATRDFNGLNDGVYFVRVSEWAIDLFTDILAFRRFRPEVHLQFVHQSIMEKLLREDRYRAGVRYVPQYWFNSYPLGGSNDFETRTDTAGMSSERARRGDFIVHFAGDGDKKAWIDSWDDVVRRMGNVWQSGTWQRNTTGEIERFWANHH